MMIPEYGLLFLLKIYGDDSCFLFNWKDDEGWQASLMVI